MPEVYINYADIGSDLDQRNYEVSFEKVNNLVFKTKISIEDVMSKLLEIYKFLEIRNKYKNV